MIQPKVLCYSQSAAVIDGWLWKYGVTSWGYKVSKDDIGMVS